MSWGSDPWPSTSATPVCTSTSNRRRKIRLRSSWIGGLVIVICIGLPYSVKSWKFDCPITPEYLSPTKANPIQLIPTWPRQPQSGGCFTLGGGGIGGIGGIGGAVGPVIIAHPLKLVGVPATGVG